MTSYTLSELFEKRTELAGEIILTEKRVRQLRDDLAHVEATIRILRPGIEMPKLVAKRIEFRPRYFKRGALTRMVLDFLRDHPGDVTVADIMPTAAGERTLNVAEHRNVAHCVYQALAKLAKRGLVVQTGSGWKTSRFRLAVQS